LLPEDHISLVAAARLFAAGPRKLKHALSSGAHDFDHGWVIRDLLQDGSHR
jgi:hypothetical protein